MESWNWSTAVAPHSDIVVWAVQLVRTRVESLEQLRAQTRADWGKGKHIHDLRTHARRLRAALEDLHDCIPSADALLAQCKALSDKTTQARDAAVMARRLRRYRRFAMPAERAEIKALCRELDHEVAKGKREAKHAVKARAFELAP